MTLKLYNTLTRKKEAFKPIKKNKVNMFVCGMTVYDYPHLGHAKTYIQFDIIVKYLRYLDYDVFYLQNVTDIDDKIIQRARELKIKPKELAIKYEKIYHEDEAELGINSVTKYARATDYINQIVKQVKTLLDKGFAYKIEDGYYFDLSKFKDYGKLSKTKVKESERGVSRIDESVNKRNKADFCLWKFSKPNEPNWRTELGDGRPGWHIEDTSITETEFGVQYDIHGGAVDLIFPHHEAEIAQMESASGKKPLVRYWMHTGFLNVEGKKMAKSLKNFITIRDSLKDYDANVLRYLFASVHYRSRIDFSKESLEQSKSALDKLNNFLIYAKDKKEIGKEFDKFKKDFFKHMNNDINTPLAFAVLFDLINYCYKKDVGGKKVCDFLLEIDNIFNILERKKEKIPKEILNLVKEREKARQEKNYGLADHLREKIKEKGYYVDDTEKGSIVKKL